MSVRLFLPTSGRQVARRVTWARTPLQRAGGLLTRPALARDEALVLEPARRVHTFGMRYSIDVCFCDARGCVLHVVRGMAPGHVTPRVRAASFAVETAAGGLARVAPGDQLSFEDSDR